MSTINEWMERAERLERELAEAKAQVAALRDVISVLPQDLIERWQSDAECGVYHGEDADQCTCHVEAERASVMLRIKKALADTATAARRHDAEVAARALEDASRWFDVEMWQTRKAFAWQSNTVCNELRRIAAEKRSNP